MDRKDKNQDEWTPIHFAAVSGSLKVIYAMISRGARVDPTDKQLKTPLMLAIQNQKVSTARALIEFGADINFADVNGNTVLMYACKH